MLREKYQRWTLSPDALELQELRQIWRIAYGFDEVSRRIHALYKIYDWEAARIAAHLGMPEEAVIQNLAAQVLTLFRAL